MARRSQDKARSSQGRGWGKLRPGAARGGLSTCILTQQQCSQPQHPHPSLLAMEEMTVQLSEDHRSYSGHHHDVLVSHNTFVLR